MPVALYTGIPCNPHSSPVRCRYYDYLLFFEEKTDLEKLSNFTEVTQLESYSLQNWVHSLHTTL